MKRTPFAVWMNRFMIGSLLLLGGGVGYHQCKTTAHTDNRSPEEVAMNWCVSRQPLMGKDGSACTREWAKNTGNTALCVLNQMGFPQGDSYEGPGKIVRERKTLDFFTDTHLPGQPQKYENRPSLHQYLVDNIAGREAAILRQESLNSNTKNSLSWFMQEFEEYKRKTGNNGPNAFEDFVRTYQDSPLECMRDYTGDCIKMKDGRLCTLLRPLAQQLNLVQIKMHDDKKGQMIPYECSRTNLEQSVAYVDVGQQGCKVTTSRPNNRAVVLPGNSYHETDQAFHLANWREAEPYLAEIGVACDAVDGDPGHCSFGEAGTEQKLIDATGWLASMGDGWRTLEKLVDRFW